MNISGSFKIKYSSVKCRMLQDNPVDVVREPGKMVDGMEFLEAEASLRDPQNIIQLERHFSFTNYITMVDDEVMEVTAV